MMPSVTAVQIWCILMVCSLSGWLSTTLWKSSRLRVITSTKVSEEEVFGFSSHHDVRSRCSWPQTDPGLRILMYAFLLIPEPHCEQSPRFRMYRVKLQPKIS